MMASGEFDSMSGLVCSALGFMRATAERVIEVQQLTDQAKLALGELKAGAEGTVTDADIISLAVRYMLEQVNRGFRIELPVVDSGDEETPPCPSS